MANIDNKEDYTFEDCQKQIKSKIFLVMKNYLQHSESINPFLVYFVILLQSLQILWFSIHPQLTFLNNPLLLSQFRSFLSYLSFERFLATNNQLLLSFVVLATSITFIHVITIVISVRAIIIKQQIKREYIQVIHKIAAYQIFLFNTVFVLPIFNISIIALYCNKSSIYYQNSGEECYNVPHIIFLIFCVLNILVILIESFIYWYLFYLRNPFSKSYYAVASNLFRLGKQLIKLVSPLYFLIDFKYGYINVFIFLMTGLLFGFIFFLRINTIHSFNQNYFYLQLFLESVILWFFTNTIICYQIPPQGINFIQSCICSLLFASTVCILQQTINKKFIERSLCQNIKKPERERFVYMFIRLIFGSSSSSKKINPIIYIKLIYSTLKSKNQKIQKFLYRTDLKTQELMEISYEILLTIFENYNEDSVSINLKVVKCWIKFELGTKIVALYQLSQIRPDKVSTYEEFVLFYFKSSMILTDENESKGAEENLNDINQYLFYVEKLNQLEHEIQKCTKINEEYWEQLCQDEPSIIKIYNLSQCSIKLGEKIENIYKNIEAIFPENMASMSLYLSFLEQVYPKLKQYRKIFDKFHLQRDRAEKKNIEGESSTKGKIRFKANDTMCVLQVSTLNNNFGFVTNCNSQIKKFLGYEKSEIINQKVTKIMPKIYSQIHDSFIKRYLNKADSMKLPTEKTVFAFKKNYIAVQTNLAVKIFPNINTGYQLVGFFKQANDKQVKINLLVNMNTLDIEGMTDGFIKLTQNRLKLNQLQKQPLHLSHVFPEIEQSHSFRVNQPIQTVFRFSDCTDKLIDLQQSSSEVRKKLSKQIVVQMFQLNVYENVQLGIFSVKQINLISVHDTNQKTLSKDSRKKLTLDKSQKENNKLKISDYIQQSSIERKLQEFALSNSHLFQMRILNIVFTLFFTSLTIVSIVLTSSQIVNTEHSDLFQQIFLSNNISKLEGQIAIRNSDLAQLSENWQQNRKTYRQKLLELEETISNLFQKSINRQPDKLIINEFSLYSFNSMGASNFTSNSYSNQLHYIDGILQIIFVGLSVSKNNIQLFKSPLTQQIETALNLVEDNMKYLLPSISVNTTLAYKKYCENYFMTELFNGLYFVVGQTAGFIFVYILICILISKYFSFTNTVIAIYNSILKWDAYELCFKCRQFKQMYFESSFLENKQGIKNYDTYKFFPKTLLVKLSQFKIKLSGTKNKKNTKLRTSIFNTGQESVDTEELTSYHRSQIKKKEKNDKRQMSKKTSANSDFINISTKYSLKKKYVYGSLFLVAIILINFSSLIFKNDLNNKTVEKIKLDVSLGQFCKSSLYTLFYGTQILRGDTSYLRLYKEELAEFYKKGQAISSFINSKQDILKISLRDIELINSLIMKRVLNLTETDKLRYISQAKRTLISMSEEMTKIWQDNIQIVEIEQEYKKIRIIKICVQICLILLFCKLIQTKIIGWSRMHLNYCLNLIKMIPIWVITKNRQVINLIRMEQEKEQSGWRRKGRKIQQGSLADLKQNQKL